MPSEAGSWRGGCAAPAVRRKERGLSSLKQQRRIKFFFFMYLTGPKLRVQADVQPVQEDVLVDVLHLAGHEHFLKPDLVGSLCREQV